MTSRKRSTRQRGMTLLAVLWAATLLAVLVAGIQGTSRIDVALTMTAANVQRARLGALSGVELARAVLAADAIGADSLEDDWAKEEQLFTSVEVGDAVLDLIRDDTEDDTEVAFGLTDESSKVNVSTATKEMLSAIPGVSDEIAEGIVSRRENEEEGGPFRSVRELLLVPGVTAEVLFGEDANGNGILDPSEDDRDDNPPPDNGDGHLDRGLAGVLTVWSRERNVGPGGEARVSIKTASESALVAGVPTLTEKEAKAIVEYRKGKQLDSVAALLDVTEANQEQSGQAQQSGASSEGRSAPSSGGEPRPPSRSGADQGGSRSQSGSSSQGGAKVFSQERFAAICDYVTVSEDTFIAGKINVNTAGRNVLAAIPGIGETFADRIISRRTETGPFENLGTLFKLRGFTTDAFRRAEKFITVRSATYSLHAVASAGKPAAFSVIDAVVLRDTLGPTVVYLLERSL